MAKLINGQQHATQKQKLIQVNIYIVIIKKN